MNVPPSDKSVPPSERIESKDNLVAPLPISSPSQSSKKVMDQVINRNVIPILEKIISQNSVKILQGTVKVGDFELLNLKKDLDANELTFKFIANDKIEKIQEQLEAQTLDIENIIVNRVTSRNHICFKSLFNQLPIHSCFINNETAAEGILTNVEENLSKGFFYLMNEENFQNRKSKEHDLIRNHLRLGVQNLNNNGLLDKIKENGEKTKLTEEDIDGIINNAMANILDEFDKLGLWITTEDQALFEEKKVVEVTLLSLNQLSSIDLDSEAEVKELIPIALRIIHVTQQLALSENPILKRMQERRKEENEIEKEEQQRKVIQVDIMRTEQRLENKKREVRNLEGLMSDINRASTKIVVNYAEPRKPDVVLKGTAGAPIK